MDNPEKLATHGTQDGHKQNKNTRYEKYVLDSAIRKTNTNVNKTRVPINNWRHRRTEHRFYV